jgi:hypothetical protein
MASTLAFAETDIWLAEKIDGLSSDMRIPYPGVTQTTEIDAARDGARVVRDLIQPLTLVARHRMVRDERWKLVSAPTRSRVKYILFDTLLDPAETHDVAAVNRSDVGRLRGALLSHMQNDNSMVERDSYFVPRALNDGAFDVRGSVP